MNDEVKPEGEQNPEPSNEGLNPTIEGLIGRAQYMLGSLLDAYYAVPALTEHEKAAKDRRRDDLESRIVDLNHTKKIREMQYEELLEGQRLRALEYEDVQRHRRECVQIYRAGFQAIADAIREVGAALRS